MGIQGLLPLLKSSMEPIHVKQLEGRCVAVDTYSWLHKGALSCSRDLCKGLTTTRHIEYCMHRVNLLRHYGVTPILVFDGGWLPMKMEQESKRARSRKENLNRAIELEADGNSAGAFVCYQKAVDITPLIAHEFIQVLRQEKVTYVVAPYEADAQMAYMALNNQVDAVITEDSDLIPFGCPRIIFKMDKFGQGMEFHSSRLQKNKGINFSGFTKMMLLEMCILSGCDYLQSLPGMGIKRAHGLIAKFKTHEKVIKHLKYSSVSVPSCYEQSFKKAIMAFRHQRVYDTSSEDIVHLLDVLDNLDAGLDFLGPLLPKSTAMGIAKGELDPFTKLPFQVVSESSPVKTFQLKNKHIKVDLIQQKPDNGPKNIDLPVQKNLLTKYFCFASLEAKRKFKPPRRSPVTVEDSTSPSSLDDSEAEIHAKTTDSPALFDSGIHLRTDGNNIDACKVHGTENAYSSGGDKMEDCASIPSWFQEHRPSQALLKECEKRPSLTTIGKVSVVSGANHANLHTDQSKTNKSILVSRYFKRKSLNHVDQDNEEDHDLTATALLHATKPWRSNENMDALSTFRYKSKHKESKDSIHQSTSALNTSEHGSCHDTALGTERRRGNMIALKRMAPPSENVESKNQKVELVANREPTGENGAHDKKFGSNVSHIPHYTGIAEKSMERFVSIMSSLGYSNSGTRASGLRAPLNNVKNTCTNRLTASDFSRFAYVKKTKRD